VGWEVMFRRRTGDRRRRRGDDAPADGDGRYVPSGERRDGRRPHDHEVVAVEEPHTVAAGRAAGEVLDVGRGAGVRPRGESVERLGVELARAVQVAVRRPGVGGAGRQKSVPAEVRRCPYLCQRPTRVAITQKREHVMTTNYNAEAAEDTIQPAAPKPKRITKRAALAATLLVSSSLALVGLGLGSGIAQAQPVPAPQHYWHYCEWNHDWYFFDWGLRSLLPLRVQRLPRRPPRPPRSLTSGGDTQPSCGSPRFGSGLSPAASRWGADVAGC
jgi:hypothetical protein